MNIESVKRLTIEKGDIIYITLPDGFAQKDQRRLFDELAPFVRSRGGAFLLIGPRGVDFSKISDERLAEFGLQRVKA